MQVRDVSQRIAVDHDEVRELAGLDRAHVEIQRLRRIHRRCLERVVGRHSRHHVRHQLAVEVDRVRGIGAGNDEGAGAHRVENHLAAAGGRIDLSGECVHLSRGELLLNPLRIQLEAWIVQQLRLALEEAACASR